METAVLKTASNSRIVTREIVLISSVSMIFRKTNKMTGTRTNPLTASVRKAGRIHEENEEGKVM